ncbi:MAG: hypothetical protein Q9157_000516 [Trypethelium eluteriae]
MSPFRYQQFRDHFLQVLNPYFIKAAVPPEAPEKLDYGDIDVLVEQHFGHRGLSIQQIASLLQAKRHVSHGDSMSFAVKLPSELEDTSVPFAQLDISTCRQGDLEWGFFMNSYGDLWQIIGLTIRDLGLTASDRGLHVRIPEIEVHNAKESRLFMTHDPVLTMQFMGLDEKRFGAGFNTENEMFAWIAGGRLFSGSNCEQRQNSNDRQRLRKRPQFKRFLDEWVPNNQHLWIKKQVPSRLQVLQEALSEFNLQSVYNERLQRWQEANAEKEIMSKIASTIPLDNSEKLNLAMRSMKRWTILSSGEGLSVRSEPAMEPHYQCSFSTAVAEMGEKNVLEWVRIHWEDIVEHEKQRVKTTKNERDAAKRS